MNKRTRKNHYPLQKVVGHRKNEYGTSMDVLECGHSLHAAKDIFGARYPDRRRCRHCAIRVDEETARQKKEEAASNPLRLFKRNDVEGGES